MRWLLLAALFPMACRTRPWELDQDGPTGDAADLGASADRPRDLSAAPDVVPPDLARIDFAIAPGCADGTREGFLDPARWPAIAACAGAFRVPGVLAATRAPACGRRGGNDGPNPSGAGCNVEDLCAGGWHVCRTAAEVRGRSPTGCAGAAPRPGQFFVTRQSSNGCGVCATGASLEPRCDGASCTPGCAQTDVTANDVFGCGSTGAAPHASCSPLDRFGNNLCESLPPSWSCGGDGVREAHAAVLLDGRAGGALCCLD